MEGNGSGQAVKEEQAPKAQIVITLYHNGKMNVNHPKNKEVSLSMLANAMVLIGLKKEEKMIEVPPVILPGGMLPKA